MSEPTGRLAWGQAGVYDAADDRAVIAAVTRYRLGLVAPVAAVAGAGLQILVGPWLGVVDCGDRTSAVAGSTVETAVTANPGPATGSRADVIWCDVEPDEGTWALSVITAAAAAGRPGLPVAWLTVPANAVLASQIDIRPAEATLERRILGYHEAERTGTGNAATWPTAPPLVWTGPFRLQPGYGYRVRFSLNSPRALSGSLEGRIGVGWHLEGAPSSSAVLARSAAIRYGQLNVAQAAEVEFTFRHPITAAPASWEFEGRLWSVGAGTYVPQAVTGQGPGCVIYAEDMGS